MRNLTWCVILLVAGLGHAEAQEISHSTKPVVIKKVEPEYSDEARAAKLQGEVVLSTLIDIDGWPMAITVTRKLGMGLDEKAVECLRKWRFKPATLHGEPVPEQITVVMNFRLK